MNRVPIVILAALLVAGGAVYMGKTPITDIFRKKEVAEPGGSPFGPVVQIARPSHFQCPEPNLMHPKRQRKLPPLTGIAGMSLEWRNR